MSELDTKLDFSQKVEAIKDKVNQMISIQRNSIESPSWMWNYFDTILSYNRKLPADSLKLIRLHSKVITGSDMIKYVDSIENQYYSQGNSTEKNSSEDHPYPNSFYTGNSEKLQKYHLPESYRYYTQDIPEELHISEPQLPSETGLAFTKFLYKDKILNPDILRFQIVLSNMYRMKILDSLPNSFLTVDIGSGYGGFGYHLNEIGSKIGKKSCHVLVDLPETLFFAGVFLTLNHANKKIYIYEEKSFHHEFLTQQIQDYDYVLLPNFVMEKLYSLPSIDLMISLKSFQEMLPNQVEQYLKLGKEKLNGFLISNNYDYFCVHGYTDFKKRVGETSKMFEKYFELFPSFQFYQKNVPISKHFMYYKNLYFLFPKGKNYPIKEFWMKLRGSYNQAKGIDLSIFFTQDENKIQTKIKKTLKITWENFFSLFLYLNPLFVHRSLKKLIPSIAFLYFPLELKHHLTQVKAPKNQKITKN